MSRLGKILIVGGGIGGMSCAIQLAKSGIAVVLVDADPNWRVYGAGITLTGPTFRAFRELGVIDEVIANGFACRGSRTRTQDGTLLGEVLDIGLERGIPNGGGILRPVLHRILSEHIIRAGIDVRLGLTVDRLTLDEGEAYIAFSDSSEERFDLVVGADGINSKVRLQVFPDAPTPRFTGQGAWRVLAPRPAGLDMIELYLGDPIKAGVTPVSNNQLYMFALSPQAEGEFIAAADQFEVLRAALIGFGGLIGQIRDTLGPDSPIVYRPLEVILMPPPWHRGRVVIIGDAVHATTPHLASGAGCAVEDGLVLAEELTNGQTIEQSLTAFCARRYERCRDVVETSVRLGEMELAGAPGEEQGRIYGEAMVRLTAAI